MKIPSLFMYKLFTYANVKYKYKNEFYIHVK